MVLNQNFYDRISNYPEIIQKHLIELFEETINISDLNNLISIVLIGSSARNELAYDCYNGEIDIHSDYEFILVFKKNITAHIKKRLDILYHNLQNKWQIKSPLFHIDYGTISLFRLKYTPPTLWAYEVKYFGLNVYGPDVKKYIKKITIKNLDFGNLNHLIIVRLWNMLMYINNGFVDGENNEYENFIIKFYYCRNILDILTILLPNNGTLLAGYNNRNDFFNNSYNESRWSNYIELFNKANNLKVNMIDEISINDAQELFINGYKNLIIDLLEIKQNLGFEKLTDMILQTNVKIFKESPIKYLRNKDIELKLFKNFYKYHTGSISLFFNNKLRTNLIIILLMLHKSLNLNINENEKTQFLKYAIESYNVICFNNKFYTDDNKKFETNFKNFRQNLNQFMLHWFYGRSNVSILSINNKNNWRRK